MARRRLLASCYQGKACPFIEVAGGGHRVERLNSGPQVTDCLGTARRFHGDCKVKRSVGIVYRCFKVDMAAGESGASQSGLAQRAAPGSLLVASFGS